VSVRPAGAEKGAGQVGEAGVVGQATPRAGIRAPPVRGRARGRMEWAPGPREPGPRGRRRTARRPREARRAGRLSDHPRFARAARRGHGRLREQRMAGEADGGAGAGRVPVAGRQGEDVAGQERVGGGHEAQHRRRDRGAGRRFPTGVPSASPNPREIQPSQPGGATATARKATATVPSPPTAHAPRDIRRNAALEADRRRPAPPSPTRRRGRGRRGGPPRPSRPGLVPRGPRRTRSRPGERRSRARPRPARTRRRPAGPPARGRRRRPPPEARTGRLGAARRSRRPGRPATRPGARRPAGCPPPEARLRPPNPAHGEGFPRPRGAPPGPPTAPRRAGGWRRRTGGPAASPHRGGIRGRRRGPCGGSEGLAPGGIVGPRAWRGKG